MKETEGKEWEKKGIKRETLRKEKNEHSKKIGEK